MDVPVASRETSGEAGAEVVDAEEVPDEAWTPEVPEEAWTPEEILEGDQDDPQEVERLKIAPDPGQPTRASNWLNIGSPMCLLGRGVNGA